MTIMVYVYCPMSVVTSHHFLPSNTQIGVTLNDVTSFPAKIAYKAISSTNKWQEVNHREISSFREDLIFTKLRICIYPRENFRIYSTHCAATKDIIKILSSYGPCGRKGGFKSVVFLSSLGILTSF